MDLWIRSQDREDLILVDEYLSIEETNYEYTYANNPHQRPFYIESSNCMLGFYATKERALEVLDEIENALLNKWANNVKYEEHYDDEKPSSLVYKMPEE